MVILLELMRGLRVRQGWKRKPWLVQALRCNGIAAGRTHKTGAVGEPLRRERSEQAHAA